MSNLLPHERVLARVLRAERQRQGRKLVEVAADIGVTPAALSMWELGDRRPSPDLWPRWAGALGFRDAEVTLQRV